VTPAESTVKRWREDERGILQYADEQFQFQGDPWQEKALLAFASPDPKYQRISLQACVGPGKTAVLSIAGCWFLGVQGDKLEHPQGACVAITGDNLRDNLWKEYAKWIQRSDYMRAAFTQTARRIFANHHPETWFLSARSWPKSANADEQGTTLAGLHSKYVLVQADESGAIPTPILRSGEQALAQAGGGFAKFLQAGNPVSLEGMLHAAANELRHLWHVIRITGDPDDPEAWVHSPRVGPNPRKWATEQIATYGRENPWVKSYILGQFPPSSINALLGLEDVEAAMARQLPITAYEWAQKRLGVDVARFGDDRTVIFPRQGLVSFKPVVMRHARDSAVSVNIANQVLGSKLRWGSELEFFDATGGWAAGAVDVMRANGAGPINVQFAAPAIDPRYANRRAEIWFAMSEWIKGGGVLPRGLTEIVAELTTPTYAFNKGKFLLEEKDHVKIRLGRSPDLADALALTFGMPDMPGGQMQQQIHGRPRNRAVTQDDVDADREK
jgi:hypothetical protein